MHILQSDWACSNPLNYAVCLAIRTTHDYISFTHVMVLELSGQGKDTSQLLGLANSAPPIRESQESKNGAHCGDVLRYVVSPN